MSTPANPDPLPQGAFRAEAEHVREEQLRRGVCGPPPFTRDLDADAEVLIEGCRKRLKLLRRDESIRDISERTLTNRETTRRYMASGDPGLCFVIMAVRAYGLSAEWVLFGTGPPRLRDVTGEILCERSLAELQQAVVVRTGHLEREVHELHKRVGREQGPASHPPGTGIGQAR